ncbi:aspartic proteinase nepenthesin-2-like [Dioscorea cayenensis subsp. rotundata]|uniref:Aspartic proteinase nepenthesin-2-like n=1 Tax=Dioscorea cayennensis subsp. rotundata TaxID=55577 RepID=A0AB40CQC5_DIOCR|nr:aspartic proteinase nepenthesin-2-like [Dioscorea cayenensis subsp. rotundata]
MSLLTIATLLVLTFFGLASDLINIDANDMSFEIPVIYNGLSSPISAYINPTTNVSLVSHAGYMDELMQLTTTRRGLMYSVDIAIGTPCSDVTVSLDTGSDITWVQCEPCRECFDKFLSPIFDPKLSSTYKTINCQYQHCGAFYSTAIISCAPDNKTCMFGQSYMDESAVAGPFSEDYFHFQDKDGRKKRSDFPLKFGCVHGTRGDFSPYDDGILGMGRGKVSLISQLNISRFSHCLSMSGKTSYLSFGDAARLEGKTVRLIENEMVPSHYYVNLLAISILDGKNHLALDIPPQTFAIDDNGRGGFILDTGTTITQLHRSAYAELSRMLSVVFLLSHISTVHSIYGLSYEYCFDISLEEVEHISVVFTIDLVDVKITGNQLFYEDVDATNKPIICLAIFESDRSNPTTSILGGVAMSDYNIDYDLHRRIVTFNSTTC